MQGSGSFIGRGTRWPVVAGIAVAAVVAGLVLAPATGAYVIGGKPWPHGVIRYYNTDRAAAKEVRFAVRTWNHSGAHVRFVRTSRARASVVIVPLTKTERRYTGSEVGFASVGYVRKSTIVFGPTGRPVRGAHVWLARPQRSKLLPPTLMNEVAIHEFGHILGLNHPHKCATMDASLGGYCHVPRGEFECRPLEPDDVAGAIHLYGGLRRQLPPQRFCNYFPRPAPPIGLTDEVKGGGTEVVLHWTAPNGYKIAVRGYPHNTISGYVVDKAKDRCVRQTKVTSHSYGGSEKAGQHVTDPEYPSSSGRWCFGIQTADVFGQLSKPSDVWVTIPSGANAVPAKPRRTGRAPRITAIPTPRIDSVGP